MRLGFQFTAEVRGKYAKYEKLLAFDKKLEYLR